MKKILKWLAACGFAMVVMLGCVTAFADAITSVELETNPGTLALADTPDGTLPRIGTTKQCTLKVTTDSDAVRYASLTVVPVENGIAKEATPENAVLMQQQEMNGKTAIFDFGLKEPVREGVYAVHIGASGCAAVTKYFAVKEMNTILSIAWATEKGSIEPVKSADTGVPIIKGDLQNTVTVNFAKKQAGYASLTILPVADGKPLPPTPENVVLMQQQRIVSGTATFQFSLKSPLQDGVYAAYFGGTDAECEIRYFAISTKVAPKLNDGGVLQYDDYKNQVSFGFTVDEDVNFEDWSKQKDAMEVTLHIGERRASINPADITFDLSAMTMTIHMQNYADVLPAMDAVPENHRQTAELTIMTPGYRVGEEMNGTLHGSVTLMAPKISAEGFADGVDFEIELYAKSELVGANAIIALYDDGALVDMLYQDGISVAAGETKKVPLTFQSNLAKESGKFSVKVMLWDAWSAMPITTCVVFP